MVIIQSVGCGLVIPAQEAVAKAGIIHFTNKTY
jgi:hypothetical protein